jgi:hypothetical protein
VNWAGRINSEKFIETWMKKCEKFVNGCSFVEALLNIFELNKRTSNVLVWIDWMPKCERHQNVNLTKVDFTYEQS